MPDILDLLLNGDPAAAAKRQAAALRGQDQMQEMLKGANEQGNSLNVLNFVAQNANNPVLAKSMAALNQHQQSQYAPTKLDKGLYVPATGQYQESPGVADEKDADRENKRLAAASLLQARQEATQAHAIAQAAQNETRREAILQRSITAAAIRDSNAGREEDRRARAEAAQALREERLANTKHNQQQNQTAKFSKALDTSAIPQISDAVEEINKLMKDESIPGVGYGQKALASIPLISDITVGDKGKANRSVIQRLENAMMLAESGKAVTVSEEVRQAVANMANNKYNEKDFRNAWKNTIRPFLENVRVNTMRSADKDTVESYMQNAPGRFDPRRSYIPDEDLIDKYLPKK